MLKEGFIAGVCEVLNCVCGLHAKDMPRVPAINAGFRSGSAWHSSLLNESNGLLARASSVALLQHGDEHALCALLLDVVRALFAYIIHRWVHPLTLDTVDAARARSAIEGAALTTTQIAIPVAAPRSLSGLSEDELASI